MTIRTVIATLLLSGILFFSMARGAFAQCAAATLPGKFQDTFVEPEFTDCPGSPNAAWGGDGWGGAGGNVNNNKLDQDMNWVPGGLEDADADAVFATIQCAINHTNPGGTVHVTVPGVYREALTITDPISLRGGEGMDVILEGGQGACASPVAPIAGIFVNLTNGGVVRLENLTVRDFAGVPGVQIGNDLALLDVVDCRIEGNRYGVMLSSSQTATSRVEIVDCAFSMNELDGINLGTASVARLSVNGTQIWANGRDGIQGSWETPFGPVLVQSSRIRGNGAHGILISGNPFGGAGMQTLTISGSSVNENATGGIKASGGGPLTSLVITDSEVSRNGSNGIEFNNASLVAVATVSVGDSRIEHNAGIGFKITSAGGAAKWSAWHDTFASNVGAAINDNLLPLANSSCIPGDNLFAMNAGGNPNNFVGLGANNCQGGIGSQNQIQ